MKDLKFYKDPSDTLRVREDVVLTAYDDRTHRIRVRKVDTTSLAQSAAHFASSTGTIHITAHHGGDVCNSYGYPAQTEGAVLVAFPPDTDNKCYVVVFATQLSANKVSLGGVVGAAVGNEFRPIFDRRYSKDRSDKAFDLLVKHAREYLP